MREAKYTPGPWITEKTGSAIWIGANAHRTDGKVEKIVTHIEIDSEHKTSVKVENEANAKLIAAAPELLEALQNIIEQLDECPDYKETISGYKKAKAAIKKATE